MKLYHDVFDEEEIFTKQLYYIYLRDQSKLALKFNNYYVSMVEKSSGIRFNALGTSKQYTNDYWILEKVI